MSSKTTSVTWNCLCRALEDTIEIPSSSLPLKSAFCHCTSCRHLTGTLANTCVGLPDFYKPSGKVLDQLIPFDFSKDVVVYHCRTCGSASLGYSRIEGGNVRAGQWFISSGALHQADGIVEVAAHIHLADTLDGGFADFVPAIQGRDIPRYAHFLGAKEQLPLPWRSPEQNNNDSAVNDKLHCHCKCRGVQFWISRSSDRSKNAMSPWPDVLIADHLNQKGPEGEPWWLQANGTRFLAGVCACNSCRLDTGTETIQWAFVPTVDIHLDAGGEKPFELPFGTLNAYGSSKGVVRYHCSVCGASVFFTSDQRENLVDVAIGLMAATEGARAESWLHWATERLSFREDAVPRAESLALAIEGGLKQYTDRKKG